MACYNRSCRECPDFECVLNNNKSGETTIIMLQFVYV